MENLFNATITDFYAMLIVAERYVRVRKELSTYAEDFGHHEKGYLISQESAELFAVSLLSVPLWEGEEKQVAMLIDIRL